MNLEGTITRPRRFEIPVQQRPQVNYVASNKPDMSGLLELTPLDLSGFTPMNQNTPNLSTPTTTALNSSPVQNVRIGETSNQDNLQFFKTYLGYLEGARQRGYSFQRKDPQNTLGMDCVTCHWRFLEAYLSPEDFAKLKPFKDQAYVNDPSLSFEERAGGFSKALANAGLGQATKLDQSTYDKLLAGGDKAVKDALIGTIGTKDSKNGGHVFVISDAWIENGEIKLKWSGAHQGGSVEGNGIGTYPETISLKSYLKEGNTFTFTALNSDVIQRANNNLTGEQIISKIRGENQTIAQA